MKKVSTWLTIWCWVKKIRCRLTEQLGSWYLTWEGHSVKMLWNYHHGFGSCLLLNSIVLIYSSLYVVSLYPVVWYSGLMVTHWSWNNVVSIHRVWLVLGWVSLSRQINQLGI